MPQLSDKDRKKAEVRARLEQENEAKKKKKGGFMTPERKRKLRNLLRKKAAEELKLEQARKEAEKKRVIEERVGQRKDLSSMNEAQIQQILGDYHNKVKKLEGEKYDLEYHVAKKDFEIQELSEKVMNRPGKFSKPPLKKVSKTANQMEKIMMFTAKISQSNYRQGLKVVSVKEKEPLLRENSKDPTANGSAAEEVEAE